MPGSGFTDKRAPVRPEPARDHSRSQKDEAASPVRDDPASPVRLALYATGAGMVALIVGKALGSALFAENGTARGATLVIMMIVVGGGAGVLADPILSALAAFHRRHRR